MRRYRRKTRRPFYRRRRTTFKRRFYGRRRGSHARVRRQGYLLADRTVVKLSYTLTTLITTDSSGFYARSLSGNSLFDPDPGVGSVQPTGFDQYSAFYRFYYVAGSKCSMDLINTDAADVVSVGLFPSTNQISTTDLTTMYPEDWPYVTDKTLGPLSSSFSRCRFKKYMSTKKIHGYKTSNNSNFISAVTGSPTNQWWWNIYGLNTGGDAINLRAKIKITYYCHFFGRQEIAAS